MAADARCRRVDAHLRDVTECHEVDKLCAGKVASAAGAALICRLAVLTPTRSSCDGTELVEAGAGCLRDVVRRAANLVQRGYIGKVEHLARLCSNVAWEQLHTGNWQEVPLAWRDLYSFCCLVEGAHGTQPGARQHRLRRGAASFGYGSLDGWPALPRRRGQGYGPLPAGRCSTSRTGSRLGAERIRRSPVQTAQGCRSSGARCGRAWGAAAEVADIEVCACRGVPLPRKVPGALHECGGRR